MRSCLLLTSLFLLSNGTGTPSFKKTGRLDQNKTLQKKCECVCAVKHVYVTNMSLRTLVISIAKVCNWYDSSSSPSLIRCQPLGLCFLYFSFLFFFFLERHDIFQKLVLIKHFVTAKGTRTLSWKKKNPEFVYLTGNQITAWCNSKYCMKSLRGKTLKNVPFLSAFLCSATSVDIFCLSISLHLFFFSPLLVLGTLSYSVRFTRIKTVRVILSTTIIALPGVRALATFYV